MLNILSYFSSIEFYYFAFILIIIGAITQSAIGIGFGVPACFLILFEPTMVPSCIVLMGTFLAFSNALLSLKDVIKVDLAYSFSGRVIGSLIAIPLISLTIGTKSYLIIFGILLLITVFLLVLFKGLFFLIERFSFFLTLFLIVRFFIYYIII